MSTAAQEMAARLRDRGDKPLRFISAASLFDGHDAAINIIRRLLQGHGAEVIHLGHNRSVADIVRAALQEDADGIACSSYQGGHNEYFRYMVDMLAEHGARHVRVVVGGGGTIAPDEVAALEAHGVEKIHTPDDGMRMGLDGMIDDVFRRVRAWGEPEWTFDVPMAGDHLAIGRCLTLLEEAADEPAVLADFRAAWQALPGAAPVLGITGTGGAGRTPMARQIPPPAAIRLRERLFGRRGGGKFLFKSFNLLLALVQFLGYLSNGHISNC